MTDIYRMYEHRQRKLLICCIYQQWQSRTDVPLASKLIKWMIDFCIWHYFYYFVFDQTRTQGGKTIFVHVCFNQSYICIYCIWYIYNHYNSHIFTCIYRHVKFGFKGYSPVPAKHFLIKQYSHICIRDQILKCD
jgi:hypothetical protein